jgi:nicotinamidase-related amidase
MDPVSSRTALLIIDVQRGFDHPRWGRRNNPQAEDNIARLLEAWRRSGRQVFHVQHLSTEPESPLRPGQEGVEIKAEAAPQPGEALVQKRVHSAFIGTDLEDRLRAAGITDLVIAGLTTNHCVSTTARMANNLGFAPVVVADATAAFGRTGHNGIQYPAEQVHDLALASLHQEFAAVVETDALLAELN